MPNLLSPIPVATYFVIVVYLAGRIHKCRVKEIKDCAEAIKRCDENGHSSYTLTEGRRHIERTYGDRVFRKALKEV